MLALPLWAQGQSQNELELGTGEAVFNSNASIPLNLSTTDQVQGVVAAFDWIAANGTGVDLIPGAALAAGDTVVTRIEASYMVLGVVMDSNPNDAGSPEVLGPADDILLATAVIRCGPDPNPGVPGDEVTTPLVFQDMMYAAVSGGPMLENIVVVGGLSIGGTEGLIKTNGSFRCLEGFNRFSIAPGAKNTSGACGDARVLMDNLADVEGFVTAICHNTPQLELVGITLGAAAAAADFTATEIDPFVGGTFGVVIDLIDPMAQPPNIPPGTGQHIATYRYCCNPVPAPGSPAVTFPLSFCDNELGSPLKENVIVVGGRSIGAPSLRLVDGTFTCEPTETPVENCNNGMDDDGDGLIDGADPDCQQMFACGSRQQDADGIPGLLEGPRGGSVEVCFFVKSPEDNRPGHAQPDHIQGFSMALTYCCDIAARADFDIEGTILEAIGAEFVSIQVNNADNDPSNDPDCELIIGVLVDALPPFDGVTIPPLPEFQRVGCVIFDISQNARCDECCDIKFQDGVKGNGKVPIKNLISVENKSLGPQTMNCEVCVTEQERFFRGDCNFMPMGSMSVDIADAAAVVSFLFLPGTWKFNPPCLDACDCNDDGRVDLADAICILQFLFQLGRFPPHPGPGFNMDMQETCPDIDRTPDKLDCDAGGDCDNQGMPGCVPAQ